MARKRIGITLLSSNYGSLSEGELTNQLIERLEAELAARTQSLIINVNPYLKNHRLWMLAAIDVRQRHPQRIRYAIKTPAPLAALNLKDERRAQWNKWFSYADSVTMFGNHITKHGISDSCRGLVLMSRAIWLTNSPQTISGWNAFTLKYATMHKKTLYDLSKTCSTPVGYKAHT